VPELEVGQVLGDDGVEGCAVCFRRESRRLLMPERRQAIMVLHNRGSGKQARSIWAHISNI
jgi:hypothetical protein